MNGTLKLPAPTWFVGCGNMGGAILDGWRAGGLDFGAVTVIRPSGRAVEGTRTVTTFSEAGPPPKLVVLAFKPQKLDEVAPELRKWLSAKTVIVSLLGTAWMAATTGEDMDSVARRVASPKGTTEAGLAVLDGEHVLDDLIAATINAAFSRGAELAEQARASGSLAESERLA